MLNDAVITNNDSTTYVFLAIVGVMALLTIGDVILFFCIVREPHIDLEQPILPERPPIIWV